MALRSKVMKAMRVSLVLFVLGALAIASMLWHRASPTERNSSGLGLFLVRPAFAQADDASFLDREAGMAIYSDLGKRIDLNRAKTAFRTLEKEDSSYLIGSVPVPGYESDEEEDVHSFVHKDGWIVAYYLRDDPTSRIMYWKNWDGKTISTKVEEGLIATIGATGLASTEVRYYHFKYPGANKIMIIADKDSFKLTIPGELVVYERSYSGSCSIDGQSSGSQFTGLIGLSQLKPDVSHTIKGGNKAIFLVYQEL